MQVFIPYDNPFDIAQVLDKRRLNKQIIECGQILRAIDDPAAPWSHHPVVAMWKPYKSWLLRYRTALQFHDDKCNCERWSRMADRVRPPFLTEEFCIQHRRRLYTKEPEHYAQFGWEIYGTSEENWYYVDGKLVRYIKGKKI